MFQLRVAYLLRFAVVALPALLLGGCASIFGVARETDERQCLARVMYFESNRSSDEGMLAVGTVVMNRRESGRFPRTICGVVGQPNQFAPGALTSPMNGVGKARALRNADRVLAGARMPGMQNVMFFHTAGLDFPYSNMQYRLVAGGNAFYEKRSTRPGEAQVTQLAAIQRQQAVEPPAPPVSPRRLAATGGYVSPAMEDFGASQPPTVAGADLLPPARSAMAEPSLDPAYDPSQPDIASLY